MTDQEFESCMILMTQGDREGLRLVYEEYIGYIYAIVLDVLKNKENSEDISTDFFLKLWHIADTYKPGNGHRGWMARIARNMSIDFIRKHKREELNDMQQAAEEGDQSEDHCGYDL